MRNARSLRSVRIEMPTAPYVRGLMLGWVALGAVSLQVGCASHYYGKSSHGAARKYGVELLFPRSVPDHSYEEEVIVTTGPNEMVEVRVPVRTAAYGDIATVAMFDDDDVLPAHGHEIDGLDDGANYTIRPGDYTFKYDHPSFRPVFGSVMLRKAEGPRAKDFIRHTSIPVTPSPRGRSVLSEADLDRARNGDVVTRVVFVAHLPAVRDRLDNIDSSLRDIVRLRSTLKEQLAYWQHKQTERRVNARYSDFGWGVDIPGSDLAILQSLMGPERYHWHRFSQAEDQVKTYAERIAKLDIPERDLKTERDALLNMLQSVDVIYRSDSLLVVSPEITRPFHDPVDEVMSKRGKDSWYGTSHKKHYPYYYSGMANNRLEPAYRSVGGPSKLISDAVGEVLMIVQAGTRPVHPFDDRLCSAD